MCIFNHFCIERIGSMKISSGNDKGMYYDRIDSVCQFIHNFQIMLICTRGSQVTKKQRQVVYIIFFFSFYLPLILFSIVVLWLHYTSLNLIA